MSSGRKQLILAVLLAAWMAIAWPHLSEQFSASEQARAALGPLSWEQRTAALDEPGYGVATDIADTVPARGCVLVLSYTGPEHLRYYRSRFPYYLYPRKVRLSDRTEETGAGCEYLAVFRDTPQNLAQEPYHGHWDEHQLAERTAAMTRVFAADGVQIFRAR
ncbi:MAG TPA: hypothetical protein VEU62_13055 [Bryobacterales bacterium]|nr:hypothetical protein [Bryobacterales bacterium]